MVWKCVYPSLFAIHKLFKELILKLFIYRLFNKFIAVFWNDQSDRVVFLLKNKFKDVLRHEFNNRVLNLVEEKLNTLLWTQSLCDMHIVFCCGTHWVHWRIWCHYNLESRAFIQKFLQCRLEFSLPFFYQKLCIIQTHQEIFWLLVFVSTLLPWIFWVIQKFDYIVY